MKRALRTLVAAGTVAALVAGCSLSGNSGEDPQGPTTVTLVTHDSWLAPQEVLDAFERQSGIKISVLKQGDAGALTNKLVLTKANPIGDVAYGIDSTFASRALSEGVFEQYTSPEADRGPQRYSIDPGHRLSAVDLGDVCVNIDTRYFADKGLPEPKSFADLADAKYKDLMVAESPATSSPGLAFLLGTVAQFGDQGWEGYWTQLKANGLKTVSGWEEAYTKEFSGSSGKGPRPIVVSYASSPAAELGEDGKPRTKALLDTCYRQVEYAGVLAGGKQVEKARKVVDFLLSQQFQVTVASNMYVYPARQGVELPQGWAQAAPLPQQPKTLEPAKIQAGREQWIAQWRTLFEG
ncbi:thiamine ABC transporter substrate-binding protein [Amycolatopsis regifaucium]|uniref:ABC transporter substrate-binding protein n=1 Tax=Amycolatopsis regifaucium TaxID=546365 RepID=A0A154MV64_9PSEU|nr:thiamine ABC transporter substrate-binding protein [Amycolatopsis regifaucium]KZB87637.1 ABC transporter substrate-binding protein [Amycolatopsis regifaucium]OKA05461.1 thiamine ABC transporter substrate-binding protein [Amycolatopsis regifaucium]SFI11495.1 thiamine transport system substrate-binding protein [Amycolatopsis regifaucium]